MKLKIVFIALISLVLAACSSINLEPPVADESGANAAANAANAGSESGVAGTTVPGQDQSGGPSGAKGGVAAAAAAAGKIVYFDYDSYVIQPEFQKVIEANAKYLASDPTLRVVVEGHTDERGGREYNLALGQRRADAVRRALSLLGVADGQLDSVSFGEEKPAVEGSNEAAWAKNRRAEINYR